MGICRQLGFAVRRVELANVDGCHVRMRRDNGVLILLDIGSHTHRKRFTLAHEIGHVVLGHTPSQFDGRTFVPSHRSWQEAQANRFASELLMPLPILKQFGMLSPYVISEKFGVSIEAAEIKARQLGWYGERLRRYEAAQLEAQLDRMFGPLPAGRGKP